MGKLGLSQYLTPNRGRPLAGEELLLLQGLSADDLLLDLAVNDLAVNTMSTTMEDSCILTAIVLGHRALANEANR